MFSDKRKLKERLNYNNIYPIIATYRRSFYLSPSIPYYVSQRDNKEYLWEPQRVLKYSFTPGENVSFDSTMLIDDFYYPITQIRVLSEKSKQVARGAFGWWQGTTTLFFQEDDNPDFYVLNSHVEYGTPIFGYSLTGKYLSTLGKNFISLDEGLISNYSVDDPFFLQNTLYHEIGHGGIGLIHPFESFLNDYSRHRTTYYSIMNYEYAQQDGITYFLPRTPMPFDIDNAHLLYGKNPSTNAGDTIYFLGDYVSAVPHPNKTISSLPWDALGTDTVSAQGLEGDVTFDIRRYGQSVVLDRDIVWTPNILIENIISGSGYNRVYLNERDNIVDITASAKTDLHVAPYFNGHDLIKGFNPQRDQLYLHYDASVHALPSYKVTTVSLSCMEKSLCTNTTIQFSDNHSLTLVGTNSSALRITPVAKEVPDESQILSFAIDNLGQYYKNYLSVLPLQLGEDFINAFLMGTAMTFISELNDEILKYYNCTEMQRKTARIILQSVCTLYSIYMLQDKTSFLTQLLLNFVQSPEGLYNQYLTRYSFFPNLTAMGLLRHTTAVAGHHAGNFFTLWGKKKMIALFSSEKSDILNSYNGELESTQSLNNKKIL